MAKAGPELLHATASGQTEYMSLILGLPWLYSVDALFSAGQCKPMALDFAPGEIVRIVVDPELVCRGAHHLLMSKIQHSFLDMSSICS